jgi:hypothetical protein
MLVIVSVPFEFAVVILGRISSAYLRTILVRAAAAVRKKTFARGRELEIPGTVILDKHFDIFVKQIPADIVVILFRCRLVYFKSDMFAAY